MMKNAHSAAARLLSALLSLLLLTSIVPPETWAAGYHSLSESLNDEFSLENNAIHVDVAKDSGAFYIRTVAGDKLVKGDEYASLLWPGEDDTSFTSVRITRGGAARDYIFGKNYGDNAVSVTNDGTQIVAVWSVDSVTFTQTILLQPTSNDAHGMVVVSYTAENTGAPAEIGVRVLLDTAMGGKDYAYYNVGDTVNPVVTERELGADGYGKSIYLMDDPADPLVTGYLLNGSVGGAESKPVKTVIAHWANLASTVYDYTPDTTLNFTNAFNAGHLTSDSAMALYYDLGSVATDGSASTQLNYGLYSNEKVRGYAVAVNLQTVDALSFTDKTETAFKDDGKFTARMILQNASRKTYSKVRVYAYASGGISVLNSEESPTDDSGRTYGYDHPYYVEINDFAPGQKANNLSLWHFRAAMAAEANYGRIHFKVYDMSLNTGDTPLENDLIGEAKKYILVPGSTEKLPAVQLTGSSPGIFHTEGHRVFNVTGMRFASLESEMNNACTLKLSRADGGDIQDGVKTLPLPTTSFSINEDGSGMMSVNIDGALPEGNYKITVDYNDPAREDINAKALEFQVIDDTRYRCETYGYVAVYHDEAADSSGKNPKNNYLVEMFPDEGEYNAWKARNGIDETEVLMVFKGVFDDLTNSLPEGAGTLKDDESYSVYLSASLSDDSADVVSMSNALEFSYQEPGSSVVIKEIKKGSGQDERRSVKVDMNCKVSIAGVGTTVFNQGASCFTELKGGTRYKLIEYDDSGERNDTVGNTISLLWPSYGVVSQSIMGAIFHFRFAELGYMDDGSGDITRTVGFGGGLDLSCIIPASQEEYYTFDEMVPNEFKHQMSPDEVRTWNMYTEEQERNKTFRDKNEERAAYNKNETDFYDGDDFINYSASVQVSDILFGARSFLGFNISVGVGIPPQAYGLPSLQGVFTLRTIGQTEFRVNGNMRFWDFELEALLDLKSNDIGLLIPDELKVFIGGVTPGISLDPFGVFWLQGGGGGIKDLYETIYLQDKLPPIKLILQAQFSVLQVMAAKATVEAGLTGFGVAMSDVRVVATNTVVLDSAVVALRWYPNFAVIGSIQVDILEFIKGGGYIVGYINYDGSNPFLEIFVRAALHLPDDIPIIGGMQLGSVGMGLSSERIFGRAEAMGIGIGFSYYWRHEFDWGAKNEASPTFPELLGLGQEFDTDIDEMFEDIPTGKEDKSSGNAQTMSLLGDEGVPVYYDEENHRTLMAVPGTNFDSGNTLVLLGDDEPAQDNPLQNTLSISPDGHSVESSLADNGKSKIVVLSWDSESEAAAKAEVASISTGTYRLTLLDHELDASEQNANANLSYNEETKRATLAVTVTNRFVKSLSFSAPFGMDAVLYDVDALPEISGGATALNDDGLTVTISGTELDSFDYVNVGLIEESEWNAANEDSGYVPQVTLLGRIEKDGETGELPTSFTTALPPDLASGSYVVRLMAQDAAQTQISQFDLTDGVIGFTNPNTPSDPAAIGPIGGAGDWKVSIPVTPGADDFDGYALSVTDSEGAVVSGLTDLLFYRNGDPVHYSAQSGLLTVPEENPDAGRLIIGGHIEAPVSDMIAEDGSMTADEETLNKTEIVGFREGDYTVSVRKWKAADGIPVYSGEKTASFTVTKPEPANITISGGSTVFRSEQRDTETMDVPFYTGERLCFALHADRPIVGSWVVDGMNDVTGYSGTIDVETTDAVIQLSALNLADGVHSVTFTGKTVKGDTSVAGYAFGVDSSAPAILISSPENGSSYDADTRAVLFTGVTDPDAEIAVYDRTTGSSLTPTDVVREADTGEFAMTVLLSDSASSHQLTLSATDDLGNRSEKNFTLASSLLSTVTSLRLYEDGEDRTEQTLTAGEHTLRLVGVTAEGQTVELTDPSLIEWDAQTLEGTALKTTLSEDGTRFVVTAAEDTVGIVTAKLLVNDSGSYPVSCMVGSTLSVNAAEITVEAGESAPLGVSSKTGAALGYASADESVARVVVDGEGVAAVTGVKSGTTTVTVTAGGGEKANVTVTVTETAVPAFVERSLALGEQPTVYYAVAIPDTVPEGSYMTFDDEGVVTTVPTSAATRQEDGSYVFPYRLTGAAMTDRVAVTFHYGADRTVTYGSDEAYRVALDDCTAAGVTVSLTNQTQAEASLALIVAVYDLDGRMIAVSRRETDLAVNDAARLTVACPSDADVGFVRAFVVAPGTMLPLRDAWLLQIQQQ